MSDVLLSATGLDAFYGDSQVLFDVTFDVDEDEALGVFGRNGMGKTTLLRSLVNQVGHTGRTEYRGEDISGLPTYDIIRRGIAYVPEDRAIYADLSVEENIELAVPRGVSRSVVDERLDRLTDMFPNLAERMDQAGGTLSGGEQQMLAIARGLISEPDLLLLDEPTEGLAPVIIEDLLEALADIVAEDRAVIIVEQNINRTLSVVDRGYFIENGRLVVEGTTAELADEELQERYLTV